MASAAAIEGIGVNGLRWRARLSIKSIIPVVPNMADEDVEKVALRIKARLDFLSQALEKYGIDVPDFELDLVETKEHLTDALTNLYDWADYERILIV
jgi:hypothetical protein